MNKFIKNFLQWLNTLFGLYKIQKDRVETQIKEFELNSSDNTTIMTLLGEIKVLAEKGEFDKSWQYLHQSAKKKMILFQLINWADCSQSRMTLFTIKMAEQ